MPDFRPDIWRCLRTIRYERLAKHSLSHFRQRLPIQSTASVSTLRYKASVSTPDDAVILGSRREISLPVTPKAIVESPPPGRQKWRNLREHEDQSSPPDGVTAGVRGHLQRELVWLKDPVKLAERTRVLLAEDRGDSVDKAFELVRMASQNVQCTLCWNALIEYLMRKRKVNAAVRLYNEMKKRAQHPDAYTYTIILKGLADDNIDKTAPIAAKAVKIYHSMSAPNSRVEPSIIHTNAAMMVCSKYGDMDALWGIASRIPETGANSANNITFTIVFQSLKANVERNPGALDHKTNRALAPEATIIQARRHWVDIVNRWREGNMYIDEKLVCAMANLLLISGRPQDWDDVLSLFEQTMRIPRQARPLRLAQNRDNEDEPLPLLIGNRKRQATYEDEPDAGVEFAPVPVNLSLQRALKRSSSQSATLYNAQPSNKALSVILEACEKLCLKRAATQYWEILTGSTGHAIVPDLASCHHFLRILRVAKASSEAVKFIQRSMSHLCHDHSTYRIAMSTCVRNMYSPNVMRDARKLMDLMEKNLNGSDLRACKMWMELSLSRSPRETMNALARLWSQTATRLMTIQQGTSEDVIRSHYELVQLMIKGLNRVLQMRTKDAICSPSQRKEFGDQLAKLSAWIATIDDKIDRDPKRLRHRTRMLERFEKRRSKDREEGRSEQSRKKIDNWS